MVRKAAENLLFHPDISILNVRPAELSCTATGMDGDGGIQDSPFIVDFEPNIAYEDFISLVTRINILYFLFFWSVNSSLSA